MWPYETTPPELTKVLNGLRRPEAATTDLFKPL